MNRMIEVSVSPRSPGTAGVLKHSVVGHAVFKEGQWTHFHYNQSVSKEQKIVTE